MLKKFLSLMLAVIMVLSVIPVTASAEDSVTIIYDAADLVSIADNLSGNYKIDDSVKSIDLSGYTNWTPIGSSSTAFSGTFEGNGKTIKGLCVNIGSTDTAVFAGLFGNVTGSVKNLTVSGTVNVETSTTKEQTIYAGGVIGYVGGWFSNIEGITSSVTVSVKNTSSVAWSPITRTSRAYVGGIVGCSSSWMELNESAHTSGDVTGSVTMSSKGNCEVYVGGIAGKTTGTVTDCYNKGDVSSSASAVNGTSIAYTGGLVGNGGSFKTSYNAGGVSATATTSYLGGIAGSLSGTSTNCYFIIDGTSSAFGQYTGTADTTPTASSATSEWNLRGTKCSGFDFECVWNNNYLKMPDLYSRDKILGGTVSIDGTLEYGSVLTANISNITPAASHDRLNYQWYRGVKTSSSNIEFAEISSATKSTYTLTAEDVGKYIAVKVKGKGRYIDLGVTKVGYAGSVMSDQSPKNAVSKKTPAKPSAPVIESLTDTSITVKKVSGAEYGIATYKEGLFGIGAHYETPTYQSSNVFTGLSATTKYGIYVRIAETNYCNQSEQSDITEVTTYETGYDPYAISGTVTIDGIVSVGSKLSANTSAVTAAQSGTISYTYQWLRDGEEISGATYSTYTLTTDDIECSITVQVTAKSPYKNTLTSGAVKVSLGKVEKINIANNTNGIKLYWSAVTGADKYNVYKKNVLGVWSKITTVTTNNYIITDVTSGTEYTYTVSAVKGSNESDYDKTGVKIKYLSTPTGITIAECNANVFDIKWNAVTGATSYDIYNGTTVLKADVTENKASVENVKTNVTYNITIVAKDGDYSSAKSASVSQKVSGVSNHSFSEWQITADPDCTNAGSQERVCSICGYVDTEVIKANGHTPSNWIVDSQAGCETTGTKHKECTVCHDILETAEISANGHTPSEWIVDQEPGCTTTGTKHKECTVCHDILETAEIPANGHTPSEWITDNEPGCTTTGTKHKECTVCHETVETAEISATGHTSSNWVIDKNPTCTETGLKHGYCEKCKQNVESVVIPAKGHTFGNWVVDKKATCTENGSQHRNCKNCTYSETDVIKATGHTKSSWITDTPATAEKNGTKHIECTECKKVLETGTIIRLAPKNATISAVSNVNGGVKITWGKLTGADSYTVSRKSGILGSWKVVVSDISETTYTDKTLSSGTKYTYKVNGVNSSGTGDDSNNVSVTYLATPMVTIANAVKGVSVKWNKISGAAGYVVYRKANGDTKWTSVKTIDSGDTVSFTDTKAVGGKKYSYTVKATKGSAVSSTKATSYSLFITAPTVTVANANGYVKVSWKKCGGAKGYYVYRKLSGAKSWTKVKTVTSATTVSFKDTSVKSGKKYIYTVKAYNGKVYSAFNTSGVTIIYLSQPKLSKVTSAKAGVTFKWAKVTGANGYIVYRKTGSGKFTKIATVKGNTTVSYLDKSAKKGTTYYYTVKAYNGTSYSAYNATGLKVKDKY